MHNRITDAAVSTRGLPCSSNGLASGHVQPIAALTVAAMSGFDGLALNTAASGRAVTLTDRLNEEYYQSGLTEGAEYFVGLTGPVLLSSFAYGEASRSLGKVLGGKLQIDVGDVFVYGETSGDPEMGALSTLTTTAKTTAVAAINEINALAGAAIPKSVLAGADYIVTSSGASTPTGVEVHEATLVGRKTGGHVDDLNAADSEAIIRAALAVSTGAVGVNSQKVSSLGAGSVGTDAARLQDLWDRGLLRSARVASTADIPDPLLAAPDQLDGVNPLVVGDLVWLWQQAAPETNGLYRVDVLGTGANGQWSRVVDADAGSELRSGALVYVRAGTLHGLSYFGITTLDPITVGVTGLTIVKLPSLADLASTVAGKGAALVGSNDAGGVYTATTVEGQLQELRTGLIVDANLDAGAGVGEVAGFAAHAGDGAVALRHLRLTLDGPNNRAELSRQNAAAEAGFVLHVGKSGDVTPSQDFGITLNPVSDGGVANPMAILARGQEDDIQISGPALIDVGGARVGNAGAATVETDLVTLGQIRADIPVKGACRVATTADIADLAAGAPDQLDGVNPLVVGDRILVPAQTAPAQNGIYVVDVVGTGVNGQWSRAVDFDETEEVDLGTRVWVSLGTLYNQTGWYVATAGAIGVDPITFARSQVATDFTAADQIQVSTAADSYASLTVAEGELVGRQVGQHVDGLSGATLEAIIRAGIAALAGSLAVNSQKVTGLALSTASGEAVSYLQLEQVLNGVIPNAILDLPNAVVDGDYFEVGADLYEWDNGGGTLQPGAITVLLGGGIADARANAIVAVNTLGTENVLATATATGLMIQPATAPGGTVVAANPSIVLAETIADAADVWLCGAVNVNTLGGEAYALKKRCRATIAITAAMVAGAFYRLFDAPFTPARISGILVKTAAGAVRYDVTDQFTLVGSSFLWTSAGAVHLTNTDVLEVDVSE